jgi:hypothetical protein
MSLTEMATTLWAVMDLITSWPLTHMNASWLIGVAPLAALVVWFVSWRTKGTEGDAILYAGIAMCFAQLAIAGWLVSR